MSTLASLKTQAAQAACFTCLPVNTQEAIKAYLLAKIAGGSLDPKTLLAQSRSFFGVQSGFLPAFQAVFANIMAGGSGDITTTALKCDLICLTPQMGLSTQLLSLARAASLPIDPKALATLAACFVCVPTDKLIVIQTFLMGVIVGVITIPPLTGPALGIPPRILRQATLAHALPPTYLQVYLDDAISVFQGGGGGGGGGVPGTPTNFVFASNLAFTFVVGGWDTPPAGVTSTELWTSTDGITFVLAQTLAAPTATANVAIPAIGSSIYAKIRFVNAAGNSAFTSALVFTHTDWETRVSGQGVVPLAPSKAVQNNFYSALANAGILSKMINVGFFENSSGNNIKEALTPIIHATGGIFWTNSNMGDGMVSANGVDATGGPGVGAVPGVLGTDFPSDANGGLTVYAFTGASVAAAYACGYTNNAGTVQCAIRINDGGTVHARMWNDTSEIATVSPGAGYYSANRTGATSFNLYYASTTFPHAGLGGSAAAAGSRNAAALSFFSANAFELPSTEFGTVNNTLRVIAAHQGLTAAESLAFYNIIVAGIVFLGQAPV